MNSKPSTTVAAGTFEEVVLPHLNAGYRLACWLLRNSSDADDVVQDASLRALRYFATFTGGNGRAWFLRIVRNSCRSWLTDASRKQTDPFDEEQHPSMGPATSPEAPLLHRDDVFVIERALRQVPERYRELFVLRELRELSYREIAQRLDMPLGTVMSSLARARQAFRAALE